MTTADQHQSCAPPITRSIVLDFLQDTEELNDVSADNSLDNLASSQSASSFLVDGSFHAAGKNDTPLPLGASLEEIKLWIDAQCNGELARADWINEYDRYAQDDAEEPGSLGRGPDTAVIDRIRRGDGPCSAKYEDLLWTLRLGECQKSSRYSEQPRNESYKAIEQILLDWNTHVAIAYEDSEARQVLMDVMYARVAFLDRILSYRRSADAHDETSRKLLHAIHAYRPETATFKATDTCDLLTIILAHIGYAIPDIDQMLKYLIFYTLVTERVHIAQTANAGTRRKLEEEIARAKKQRNVDLVVKYEQKMSEWQHDVFQHNCDLIADKVRFARRNVELKALEGLQTLTILQTAQKLVLNNRLSRGVSPVDVLIPRSTWLSTHSTLCDDAATALSTATDARLPSLLANATLASQNNHDMKHVSRARILTRALKFAGLDVQNISEAERGRLVRDRMANPGTVTMMTNAIQAVTETKDNAREMMGAMETMERDMAEVLSKAQAVMEEYETLAKLVGTEMLADVDVGVESEGGRCSFSGTNISAILP